jgi:hypothetical protein
MNEIVQKGEWGLRAKAMFPGMREEQREQEKRMDKEKTSSFNKSIDCHGP